MHRFWRSLPCPVAVAGDCAALSCLAGPGALADDEAGFKPIFNGQNLDGWDGNPKFWSVKDGAISGQTTAENPTKGNTFLIWRQGAGRRLRAATELQDRRRQLRHAISQQRFRQLGRRRLPGRLRGGRHLLGHPVRRAMPRHSGQARPESHDRRGRQEEGRASRRLEGAASEHQEGRLERLRDHRPGQPPHAQDQRQGDGRGDRRQTDKRGHVRASWRCNCTPARR